LLTLSGERENRASTVAPITLSPNEPSPFEPAQNARERARVNVKYLGKVARRGIPIVPDESHDQALRTGDTNRRTHALGGRLQPMRQSPEQLHEPEHVPKRSGTGARGSDVRARRALQAKP
jgi:hypothetical protein